VEESWTHGVDGRLAEYLTGIKAVSRSGAFYGIDTFFISRRPRFAERFGLLIRPGCGSTIWQMALSTAAINVWGFLAGVSTGSWRAWCSGRSDRLARVLQPYIGAFNSLRAFALVCRSSR